MKQGAITPSTNVRFKTQTTTEMNIQHPLHQLRLSISQAINKPRHSQDEESAKCVKRAIWNHLLEQKRSF